MNISKKITTEVKEAIKGYRATLVRATVKLLQTLGARPDEKVSFMASSSSGTVVLQEQTKQRNINTRLADLIAYADSKRLADFYFLYYDGDCIASSDDLSLDSLLIIYNEVLKTVKAE